MPSKEVLTALETLHQELEKLVPAIKHVEAAQQVTQMVKEIPLKHIELLEELKQNDVTYKAELQDLFKNELIGLTDENKKLQKTTAEIQQQVKAEQEVLAKLSDMVRSFHERVEKINFPERLDKLDANVAGIMAGIQAIQSRLDGLERNISDRLKDVSDYLKETRTWLQSALDQAKSSIQVNVDNAAKKQQVFTYITWGLTLIAIALLIFG